MLNCLQQALSTDGSVQRQAEATLASLERSAGFCSCLAEVIGDKTADHSSRWLASVHLKNSVSRAWRVRADQQGISPEEKAHLRGRLLQLIPQEDNKIAVQIALVHAKVARSDFPREWPTLFNELLTQVTTGSPALVRRPYLVLHHVLKELSSKRLVADQKCFGEITQLLFSHIWERWCGDATALLAGLPASLADLGAAPPPPAGQSQALLSIFERWLLLLKILRRLVLHGFGSDAKSMQPVPAVNLCAPAMFQVLQQMLSLRPARRAGGSQQRHHLAAMLDRGVLKLMKCQRQVLEVHPWSYQAAGVLQPLVEFCCSQLASGGSTLLPPAGAAPGTSGGAVERSVTFEGFWMECMAFLVTSVTHTSYKGRGGGQAKEMAKEVQAALAAVWTLERLTTLVTALVQKYMPLTVRELDSWSECPEAFHHASDSGGWQDHLNLCAEHLYLTLLVGHREALAPVVMSMLQAISQACPAGTPLGSFPANQVVSGVPRLVLLKDAVYNAVAVGAYELHDYFDFVPWLHGSLLQELNDRSPANAPVRRRVAKLVANCVARVVAPDRPLLYDSLAKLLLESDACLQLVAIECLRALVDDWNFSEAPFVPYVCPVVARLVAVVGDSTELDTQTQAFSLMNLIIERMGEAIGPYVSDILGLLPALWVDAEGQSLLRIQILLALQRIVNVLGPQSSTAYGVVLPILQYSLDMSQPEAMNLIEDALALWLAALRHAAAAEPPLLALFPHLAVIMTASTEHIQTGMHILSSCALLAAPLLLQQYGPCVCGMLEGFIGNVTERGMLLIFPAIATLIQASPELAVHALQGPLVKLLAQVLGGKESPLTQSLAMPVFARCVLHAPQPFMALFQAAVAAGVTAPPREGTPTDLGAAEHLFGMLLDLWVERFDGISSPSARKACALALSGLLALPSRAVLVQLEGLLVCVTSVWFEQEGGGDGDRVIVGEDYTATARLGAEDMMEGNAAAAAAAGVGSEDAEGEARRLQALSEADPVTRMKVGATLRDQLNACAAVHGPPFNEAMARLDVSIANQLKAAIGMA